MEAAYTSTRSVIQANRLNVLQLQDRLLEAQQEVASGRLFDVGKTLGSRTSETLSLRQEHAQLTTLIQTNGIVATRLDGSQTVLSEMVTVAEDFVNSVLLSRDAEGGATVAQQQAQSSLGSLIDGLGTSIGGEYIFGGINTGARPVESYYSSPASAARTAVAAAFSADFGTTQSDPANDGITAAAMQTFLDTSFSAMFDPADWSANWSNASDQNIVSRVARHEDLPSSANANESPFRKLAKAYTMVADLGVENLNDAAFQVVTDKAANLASEAIQGLTLIQSRLGTVAERVTTVNDKMSAQRNVLNTQIDNLESVDPYEASTRVTSLLTQLETAYALTARVQRLSILNFL